MKDYLLKLLEHCAPENGFAQDAIEHAIVCGNIPLTEVFGIDVLLVMFAYDEIIESYRKAQGNRQVLVDFYNEIGFMAAIQSNAIKRPTTHACRNDEFRMANDERKAA